MAVRWWWWGWLPVACWLAMVTAGCVEGDGDGLDAVDARQSPDAVRGPVETSGAEAGLAPTCLDGRTGPDESDIDCGGVCGDCALGRTCRDHADCASGLCRDGACTCPEGFVEDAQAGDGRCRDLDECLEGQASCDPHAICTNSPGGYGCRCAPGWVGDGHHCAMALDCLEGLARCAPQASCLALDAGHFCVCNPGFRGDGASCENVDECATGLHDCASDAVCMDMPGRYRCLAPQ